MTTWLPLARTEIERKEHATGADPDGVLFHICPFGEGANRVSRSGQRQFARITARRDENCVVASAPLHLTLDGRFVNYGGGGIQAPGQTRTRPDAGTASSADGAGADGSAAGAVSPPPIDPNKRLRDTKFMKACTPESFCDSG